MGRDLKHIDFAAVSKALRSSSLAWNNAKIEYDQIVEVPYHSLVTKKRDGSDCRKVISQINSSLLQRINGGINALTAKSFVIEYELRCNMDNDPIYGRIENFSLTFTVDWNVCHIDITCVPGPIDAVVVDADLRAMLNEGIVRNLKKFAGLTGLYPKQVRDTHKAAQLIKVFWHGLIGQSKVTRLVKGCLMYLERLEKGPAEFKAYRPNTLRYTVEDLLPTMDYGETAYVFTTNESDVSSNAILYGMCEEYPHPNFGGYEHISIPADGKTIYLVGYELEQFKTDVFFTPEMIWGTLLQYADQFNLGSALEQALIIACSLKENRYMARGCLPQVFSRCDLVYPALTRSKEGVSGNTIINAAAATMVGRYHQMVNFVLFKDLDVSLQNTRFNQNRDLASIIGRHHLQLMEYMDDIGVVDMLKVSKAFTWLTSLRSADMDRLRQMSVFEGFWLINYPKTVLKDGVIKSLKKGYKNGISIMMPGVFFDSFETLMREVEIGSGKYLAEIPNGGFNVSFTNLTCEAPPVRKIVFDNEGEMEVGFNYDFLGPKTLMFQSVGEVATPSRFHIYREDAEYGWECGSNGEFPPEAEDEHSPKEKQPQGN